MSYDNETATSVLNVLTQDISLKIELFLLDIFIIFVDVWQSPK